jgi:Protein of unknown function (DUF2911)
MRPSLMGLLVAALFLVAGGFAQDAQTPQNAMASCTYPDGNQITVRYSNTAAGHKRDLPNGKVWSPGDVPMLLFTEVPVRVANADLGVGAYSMFVIPDRGKWTLIVNKNVSAGAAYDEKQDIVRVPMETAKLSTPLEQPQVSLGHIAPKVCSLRVDYGNTGAWADTFVEK